MNYKFILVDTDQGTDQASWILSPPVTVGRSPMADVSIGDPSISRRHCQFSNDAQGALTVRDLASMNGIYFEDCRVTKAILKPGDVVQIGSITLRIEWTDDDIVDSPDYGKACDVSTTQPIRVNPPAQKDQSSNQ